MYPIAWRIEGSLEGRVFSREYDALNLVEITVVAMRRRSGKGGRQVSYDVEPGCDVRHRNRCLRAPEELRDAPDMKEKARNEKERKRKNERSRLGSDRAKLCIRRR